jgi:capsular polysaccharide biosynthesis protein
MHGLGLPPSQVITLDEQPTVLTDGYFAGPCNAHPVVHSPTALALLRSDLPRLLQLGRPATSAERLFVTRADASTRHLGNHAAVATQLREAGYTEIAVGMLSHADQAATFDQARDIVALAGAAMANIVYCRPGTRITLLSPSTMSALYFWDLANLLSLDFRIGYFAPRQPARGIHSDFDAAPSDVMRLCAS